MNIIKERDKTNIHRRRMKEQYDSVMNLSVQESDWVPLLQEGMVTYGDGTPYFYIMRGVLRNFYDSLPLDYEGSINIGHTDLASFPERIVGRWTKNNLRLVDIEDGRQRLETNLPLNYDHPLVQALEQAEFDVGLSVEMSTYVNEELTDNTELNPFGVPIVDRVFIYDYAIVGNAGDVNSMGIHLKGDTDFKMDERLKKLASLLDQEGGSNIAEITKLMDSVISEAETVEASVEEAVEETEETVEETEEVEEEISEEETEEVIEDESVEEESEEESEEAEEEVNLESLVNTLITELEELRAENAELKAKLSAKLSEEKAFADKFKQLSVSLTKEVKRETAPKSQYTDGIGE